MSDTTTLASIDPEGRVSRAFRFYGRIGFWVQFVLLIAVALLGIYTFSVVGGRARVGNILAFLGLALPLFTTFWCYRYGGFGRNLSANPSSVGAGAATRMAWIGVMAGTAGVIVAMFSLFAAASALMVVMLANPQIGIQISPSMGASTYTISAVDGVSIMSLLLTLTAELMVVAVSLRLFFIAQTARPRSQ